MSEPRTYSCAASVPCREDDRCAACEINALRAEVERVLADLEASRAAYSAHLDTVLADRDRLAGLIREWIDAGLAHAESLDALAAGDLDAPEQAARSVMRLVDAVAALRGAMEP